LRVKTTTALAALAMAGCGSSGPAPARAASDASAAIRAAEQSGAANHPRAALHLAIARDQMRLARRMMAQGDADQASAALLRSQADAELAITLAREARLRAEARAAIERVRELQQRAGSE
jgi:hypothetical protein